MTSLFVIYLFYCIFCFDILICLLGFISIISLRKELSNLSLLLNLQLVITSFIHCISYLTYFNNHQGLILFTSIFSLLGDFGKITISIIIMLIGRFAFTDSSEIDRIQKVYAFISIFIAWVLPLSVSIISFIIGVFWVDELVLYIIVVSLRYVFIIVFFFLSGKLSREINRSFEKNEIPLELYNTLKNKNVIYRIVVGYHCLGFIFHLVLDLMKIRHGSLAFEICGIVNTITSSTYVLGFVLNKSKLHKMWMCFTCQKENRRTTSDGDIHVPLA